MSSVGETLKNTRISKKFSLDDAHKFIKIHPKFLKALEEGDYIVLSSEVHAKGFLKIYAEFLDLDVQKQLALWRREYGHKFTTKKNTTKRLKPRVLEPAKFAITPKLVINTVVAVFIIGFFSYLFYQYQSYSGAPKLEIYTPQNSIVVHSEILDVTGKTDRDSVLLINNQRVILNKDGTFATSIKLRAGLNTLSFLAVNKLGKETEETRTIIHRQQENAGVNELNVEVMESTPTSLP